MTSLSWEEPFIKKGVVCIECKVRYFLPYYMQLVVKYILILFIICLRVCHVNTPCFLSCLWRCKGEKNWDHKQRRSLWMSMTISRNSAGIKRLKDLWNEHMMIQINLIALMTNSSRHSQSSFFVKRVFQNHSGFIAPLNRKRECLIVTLIIIIVIIEHQFT